MRELLEDRTAAGETAIFYWWTPDPLISVHTPRLVPRIVSSRIVFPHRAIVGKLSSPHSSCAVAPPETQAIGGVKVFMPPATECTSIRPGNEGNAQLDGPFNSEIKCEKVRKPEHLLSNRRRRPQLFDSATNVRRRTPLTQHRTGTQREVPLKKLLRKSRDEDLQAFYLAFDMPLWTIVSHTHRGRAQRRW